MKYLTIPLFILLVGCNGEPYEMDSSNSNNVTLLTNEEQELKQLQSTQFENASEFLVSPIVAVKGEYIDPHWWSHWKTALNYREDRIPREVTVYVGAPDEDFGWGKSKKWKNCLLYEIEHYSFSKSGQLLEYVYTDSIRYFYDSNDRLRQTSVYNRENAEIEYIRQYAYDTHGNIIWNAVFYENEDGIYMNHYSTYGYHTCDSGFYLKKEDCFTYSGEVDPSSTEYFFYNNESILLRSFITYSGGSKGVTNFEYTKFEDNYYLSKKETRDMQSSKVSNLEITQRDALNRINLTKHTFKVLKEPTTIKDSTIYFSDNETHSYHFESSNTLSYWLEKTSFDAFNNPISITRFNAYRSVEFEPEIQKTVNYELLEKGTWYTSITKCSQLSESSDYDWEEYIYREFSDTLVSIENHLYQETPVLSDLVEKFIPEAAQQKK